MSRTRMPASLQQQILDRVRKTPDQLYLCQPIDRTWKHWTWAEAVDEACRLAAGSTGTSERPDQA